VQDRYLDDVGQFVKVALMRWLVSPSPYGQGHRLGIIWLQEPSGHHRIDGDHLAYLHSTHDADEDLRSLDPDLYDRLRLMAAQLGRPVSVRETCRALPSDTVRFDRPLRFDGLLPEDRAARAVERQRWFHEARVAVSPCSLVFLDSDDGATGEDEPPTSRAPADDSVLLSEIGQLLERQHSVVLHQLVEPSVVLPDLALARMRGIHEALGVEPLVLSEESHGRARLFTMIPHERHRSDLHDRIGALQLSRWGDDIRVHRWRAAYVTA
jgi:hypothetical protein